MIQLIVFFCLYQRNFVLTTLLSSYSQLRIVSIRIVKKYLVVIGNFSLYCV